MRYATVNPVLDTDILLRDLDNVLLDDGRYVRITDYVDGVPGGRQFPVSKHEPQWAFYELILSTATPPGPAQYYVPSTTYEFTGAAIAFDPASTVTETRTYAQIPIDDLLDVKRREILSQDDTVRYSSANTALVANWWIVCDARARSEWTSIAAALSARTQEIVEGTRNVANWYPGGPNQPRMQILNANTLEIRREPPTKDQYLELSEDLGTHTNETGNATHSAMQAAEALHAANDWQGLADLDPADAAWGYPPYVALP